MNASEPIRAEPLRIAVVEDDLAAQEALCLLIDGTQGFRCVGAYGSAELALEGMASPAPDVLLLDINLPGMLGSEAARHFHERHPLMAILMLTLLYDEDLIFEALCNGASGYLLKKTPPAKLLEAIADARDRGAPLSPDIAQKVLSLFKELRPSAGSDALSGAALSNHLSNNELELLTLLSEGHNYRTAAAQMRVDPVTVRACIRSIYTKLHGQARSGKAVKGRRV